MFRRKMHRRENDETASERAETRKIASDQARYGRDSARAAWAQVSVAILGLLVAVGIGYFTVTYKRQSTTEISVADVSLFSPDPEGYGDAKPGGLDITLRNDGDQLAILTRTEIRIDDFAHLETCTSGSDIPANADYLVALPKKPNVGEVVQTKVHQDVPPNGNTRFRLTFSFPIEEGGANDSEMTSLDAYIYRIGVRLVQDGDRPEIDVGEYVVAGPDDTLRGNWMPNEVLDDDGTSYTRDDSLKSWAGTDDAGYRKAKLCIEENERDMRRLLNGDALMPQPLQSNRDLLSRGTGEYPVEPGPFMTSLK